MIKSKQESAYLKMLRIGLCAVVIMFVLSTGSVLAHDVTPHSEDSVAVSKDKQSKHGNLGAVGAKLANPLSELWSLSFDFQPFKFYDGDLNNGNPRVGSGVTFQPVMLFLCLEKEMLNGGS
jgi:hypothetical protein